ncbi:MAG: LpxL/LpxP family Kdo(2)-lipid IV(A) lauroyl/palmitoleoyl acyltransferase [Candidatus Polarisedimenticolaceae bacterium]|nr:LpxL/LpxP family Kdo(2)-lipid IV(A) lauroyl/palmitoleoyl acyltransferase [Candidatus Polarisedimenticolaceae bacterium]
MSKPNSADPAWWRLLAPWHWPTWLAFLTLRSLSLLPYSLMQKLGPPLGRLLMAVWSSRRGFVDWNLKLCFPEMSDAERLELRKKNFESLGIGLFELVVSWWGSEALITKLSHVEGLEHLEAAKAKGKGVVLLCAHFTTLEISGRFLRQHTAFTPIYRKSTNPVAEHQIVHWRSRKLGPMIHRKNLRNMMRTLRDNGVIWMLPDQNTNRVSGIFVKFFGIDASTSTGISRLTKRTGSAVVPFRVTRRASGDGYDVCFSPALEDFPSADVIDDTQRINDVIEGWAREYPEQYLWIHRRFRTRPDIKDQPFYPST